MLKKPDGTLLRAIFDFETKLVRLILEEERRIGHPDMNKMIDFIHRKYFGISSLVIREFVKSCDACTRYNNLTTIQDIHVNEITCKYDRYIQVSHGNSTSSQPISTKNKTLKN